MQILPSLLAADGAIIGEELRRVEKSGADAVHLDIMDAHFVPNLSFGPDIVRVSKRVCPELKRHVHLMMTNPDLYIDSFAQAGSQTIQIHVEADCDIDATLKKIRNLGIGAGLVLRPQTPSSALAPYLELCDEVLFMTVNPGYGGQKFMPEVLPEITKLKNEIQGTKFEHLTIMVDGGINNETAIEASRAGANAFVAGSFLFKQPDMKAAVEEMRRKLNGE